MAKYTSNYNLEKQENSDYISINGINGNFDIIDTQIKDAKDKADQAFQSASNGKAAIKAAITGVDPDVNIPPDATFGQLADAIGQIETGINTEDATAVAGDILLNKTAYVKGAKVTGTIPSKTAATITPGATDQTIAANQYLTGIQTIKGDADLIPANIKKGIDIFGKVGTYEGSLDITGTLKATVKYAQSIAKGDLVTYRRHFGFDTLISLSSPSTLPSGDGRACEWSPDGLYLAICYSGTPYLSIYKRNGETLNKLANPATLPSSYGTGVSFSSDNVYLAVSSADGNGLIIYKRSGDTFTFLTFLNPGGSGVNCVEFSKDTNYLAVGFVGAGQFLRVYLRTGDTFTMIPIPSIENEVKDLTWSTDGTYLAVALTGSPFVRIFKRNGDAFQAVSQPSTIPNGSAYSCAFSNNGNYLVIGYGVTPFIIIYKRSGATFTQISNPTSVPAYAVYSCAWSPDDTYLVVGTINNSNPIAIYKRDGDTFSKLANPSVLPSGSVRGISYNPVNSYFTVAHVSSPFMTTYKGDILGDYAYKYNASNFSQDFNYPNYLGFGYAQVAGSASETAREIVTIPIK